VKYLDGNAQNLPGRRGSCAPNIRQIRTIAKWQASCGAKEVPQTICQPLLPEGLSEIRDRVIDAPRLALFLDFDGTLARIVDDPAEACLDAPTREVLEALADRDEILVTIISGRSAPDLRMRVGIEKAVYAGNHGLEISGPGLEFTEPRAAASRESLARLSEILVRKLDGMPGVLVEYKGLSVGVHYRLASPATVRDALRTVSEEVSRDFSAFRQISGKRVLDILPCTDWNKGAAVVWIGQRDPGGPRLCVYLGDDRTDEDAFRHLRDGITIHVGDPPGETSARYYVAGPAQVAKFLRWLEWNR
jgi:trehalose-phosphatase